MTGKKKLSGYENRKKTLLKAKNQLMVINKCRKIEDMFREKTSTVESKYTLLYTYNANINYTYNLQVARYILTTILCIMYNVLIRAP